MALPFHVPLMIVPTVKLPLEANDILSVKLPLSLNVQYNVLELFDALPFLNVKSNIALLVPAVGFILKLNDAYALVVVELFTIDKNLLPSLISELAVKPLLTVKETVVPDVDRLAPPP